jgi:hypothetical protein
MQRDIDRARRWREMHKMIALLVVAGLVLLLVF